MATRRTTTQPPADPPANDDQGGTDDEQQQQPANDKGSGGGGGSGGAGGGELGGSDDTLDAKIREVLTSLGIAGGTGAVGGRRVDEEAYYESIVRRQLQKVESDKELADVKQKLERIPEKQPRQFRRISRWMGWVTDDDE